MAPSKMNLGELLSITKSKWDTIGLLPETQITPMQVKCENGHEMHLALGPEGLRRFRWRCKFRGCRSYCNPDKTWLKGSKYGLEKLQIFIYAWSQDLATINYCKTN